MKYVDTRVVFREVPDEITLAINISNCPIHCPGCHSKYLWEDTGKVLDAGELTYLVSKNPGISCISLNGGDGNLVEMEALLRHIKSSFPGLKTCWYSGAELDKNSALLPFLDFIKTGPYIQEAGGLDSPKTNQRFYRIEQTAIGCNFYDETIKFRKKVF